MNSEAFNWIHHLNRMNRANFHVFKGSDWQTVAVRPTTIKVALYSVALSPIAISDVTVWSSLQRNFGELHLVLKGPDRIKRGEIRRVWMVVCVCERWKTAHTPLNQSSSWMHLSSWKWTWQDKRKQWEFHAIMFIISIGGLIEMFQNHKMTIFIFWTSEVTALSRRSLCRQLPQRCEKLCQAAHSEMCSRHLIVSLPLTLERTNSICVPDISSVTNQPKHVWLSNQAPGLNYRFCNYTFFFIHKIHCVI